MGYSFSETTDLFGCQKRMIKGFCQTQTEMVTID